MSTFFGGYNVVIDDTMDPWIAVIVPGHQIICSTKTWDAIGTQMPMANEMRRQLRSASRYRDPGASIRVSLLGWAPRESKQEVGKYLKKKEAPPARVKPAALEDRVEAILEQVQQLVIQMAPFASHGSEGRSATDLQKKAFAERYAKCAEMIRGLRGDLARTEGALDMAGKMLYGLMAGDE